MAPVTGLLKPVSAPVPVPERGYFPSGVFVDGDHVLVVEHDNASGPSATAADLGDGTVLAVSATGAVTRVATDGEQPRFAGNRIV